jgi:hypothetical protein
MNLAVEKGMRRGQLARSQLRLLPANPVEPGRDEQTDGLGARPERRGDAHGASGRVDAQAEVFDLLLNDLEHDAAQLELSRLATRRLNPARDGVNRRARGRSLAEQVQRAAALETHRLLVVAPRGTSFP